MNDAGAVMTVLALVPAFTPEAPDETIGIITHSNPRLWLTGL